MNDPTPPLPDHVCGRCGVVLGLGNVPTTYARTLWGVSAARPGLVMLLAQEQHTVCQDCDMLVREALTEPESH